MGFWGEQVLPRLTDKLLGAEELQRYRAQATEGLAGTVVELGFGSGLNVAVYPAAVERVVAVEPSDVAWRLAAPRLATSPAAVERVGLDGASLPLGDASCDAALCTFTLCTIPDVDRAVAEVHRVLEPGGRFHFLEHGRAPDDDVATWQRRIEPLQRAACGGCHLTRRPVELVERGGFQVDVVTERYVRGPKPWSFFTVGVATKS